MRVLFVCSGNGKIDTGNGISTFINSQAESLKRHGINLDFFAIKGRGIKNYLRHIFILEKFLKKNTYDIIHAHYGLCGWIALLTFTNIPIIVSFMGDDLYGDANDKGKKKLGDFGFIFFSLILQFWVDFIIVKSKNLAEHVLKKKKMQIIPNGVEFDFFKPIEKSKAMSDLSIHTNGKKYILFLGDKSNPRKNFPLLEKALHTLRDVELLAPFPVPPEKVPLYLNTADVLVLTSFKEGSPNVIKEAMACNCPIVSTDVGDVREIISNTMGCYLTSFEPGDVAEKLKLALAFGQRTAGRDHIDYLENSVIAKKLIAIYKSVINP